MFNAPDTVLPPNNNKTTFFEAPHLPDWWNQRRHAAWLQYLHTPAPGRRHESWRFAETHHLHLIDHLRCPCPPTPATCQTLIDSSLQNSSTPDALCIVFANDTLLHLPPEHQLPPGLTLLPFEKALHTHRHTIEHHFHNPPLSLGSERYTYLHAAMCTNGLLITIGKNTQLDRPIEIHHWLIGPYTGNFPQLLLIAETNSRATVLLHFHSADSHPAYLSHYTDTTIQPGANLKLLRIQNLNRHSLCMTFLSSLIERDASLLTCDLHLGCQLARAENRTRLTAPGGSSDMLSIALTDGDQILDQRTLQEHNAPHCRSDLLYKNALHHLSKTIFSGLIRVAPGACGTDAYQTNRNLLLSPRAEAYSLPGLEICNDDVKCSHGATTSPLDPEHLFYLHTRGIPSQHAHRLLVLGFLEDVLSRIADASLKEYLAELIQKKFSQTPHIPTTALPSDEWAGTGAVGDLRVLQGT